MNILFVVAMIGSSWSAWAGGACAARLRTYLKSQLTEAKISGLPGQRVTLWERGAVRQAVVIAADWTRPNTVSLRYLDRDSGEVREVTYLSKDTVLKKIDLNGEAPEIAEARRRAGPRPSAVDFRVYKTSVDSLREQLNLNRRVQLVVARTGAFEMRVFTGLVTLPEMSYGPIQIRTPDGALDVDQSLVVAAFGVGKDI